MGGIKALRRLQLGLENPMGTPVAATCMWRGEGSMEDQRSVVFPAEYSNYIGGVDRAYIPKLAAKITLDPTPATFEQICYPLSSGVKDVVTGVADGTGTGKIYAYPLSTTSKNTVKAYTFEYGDDTGAERAAYGICTDFKLSGKSGEALMMSSEWVARDVATNPFTAISLPTVEEILFGKGKLYIDPVAGPIGTTLKSNTLMAMDLTLKTGVKPVYSADNLYFSTHDVTASELTIDITFLHDATALAEKVIFKAGTSRLMKLLWEGSGVTKGTGVYEYKSLIITCAGKWEKFSVLDEIDGNDVVKGTFRARYNATGGLYANITAVNTLASLP